LRIAAPSFSGSAWSLRQALQALDGIARVQVITGSATNPEVEDILKFGSPQPPANSKPDLAFDFSYGSAVENDRRSAELFFAYAETGLSGKRLAVLAESDTAFGEGIAEAVQHGTKEALVLRFPTEIYRIRSAYQEETVLSGISSDKGEGETPEALTLKLKDSHEGAGNIPLYSPDQTTPSGGMVLQNILSTLAREKIDLTGIAATHVMDAIFLSTMIERHCRNVRPFIFDTDVLFLHPSSQVSLRGMLQVTNYPLVARNQIWTEEGRIVQRVREFPSRYSQGVYNAIQLLLGGSQAIEYARPGQPETRRPALWLTTAGSDEFWPVALLDTPAAGVHPKAHDSQSEPLTSLTPNPAPPGRASAARIPIEFEPPAKLWTVALTLAALYGLMHAAAFAYHNIFAGTSSWMSVFWLDPAATSSEPFKRRTLALGTFWLLLVVVMFGIAQCWYTAHRPDADVAYLGMSLPLVSAGALLATIGSLAFPKIGTKAGFLVTLTGSALVLGALLILVDFRHLGASGDLYGTFFVYRSLHPGNGVSPLVPVLLILMALYAWAMGGLRRLRVYEDRRAFLPELVTDRTFRANQTLIRRRLDAAISKPVFDVRAMGAAALLMAASVIFMLRWVRIESLEGPWFDIPFEMLLIVLQCALIVIAARLLFAWSALRGLLHLLECHPIRNTFSRLEGHYSWLSLWKRGASRQKFTTTIGSIERLRTLMREPLPRMDYPGVAESTVLAPQPAPQLAAVAPAPAAAQVAWSGQAAAAVQVAMAPAPAAIERQRTTEDYKESLRPMVQDLETLAAKMLDEDAEGLRLSSKLHTDLQLCMGKLSRSLEDNLLGPYWCCATAVPASPAAPLDPEKRGGYYGVFVAEEFVALRFVAHIRYVLQQLRNMVEFLVSGFILLAVALMSYPFDPNAAIASGIFVDFAALGGVVVLVFSQMDRNALLSRLAHTDAGKLDLNFVLRIVSFGALPVATLLASQFPTVGRFISAWLRPALEALK